MTLISPPLSWSNSARVAAVVFLMLCCNGFLTMSSAAATVSFSCSGSSEYSSYSIYQDDETDDDRAQEKESNNDEESNEDEGDDTKLPEPAEESGDEGVELGDRIPEIKGEDIDGVEFSLSDYEGKVVMLDFWGDW